MPKKNKKVIIEETQYNLTRIYTLAEIGLPRKNIAQLYDCTEECFDALCKRQPVISKAWRDGHNAGNAFLIGQLFQGVRDGNMTAIIFACKVRLRLSEYEKVKGAEGLPVKDKPAKIDFKAMTPQDAARVYQQVMKGDYK